MNPTSQTKITKKSFVFESVLGVFILSFATLTFFAKGNPYFPFDLIITKQIQSIWLPAFKELMVFITSLGYIIPGSIVVGVGLLGLYLLRKPAESLMLFLSTSGAVLISLIFKQLVSRPRPDPQLINQLSIYQNSDSFPSGHVLFFVGFIGYLLYLSHIYIVRRGLRIFLEIVLTLLIVLMGISRIYVGAHWFSDTLGAYLIGTVWLLFIIKMRPFLIDFFFRKRQ